MTNPDWKMVDDVAEQVVLMDKEIARLEYLNKALLEAAKEAKSILGKLPIEYHPVTELLEKVIAEAEEKS